MSENKVSGTDSPGSEQEAIVAALLKLVGTGSRGTGSNVEINLREFFNEFIRNWWRWVLPTIVMSIIAGYYAYKLPNVYTSKIVLAPAVSQNMSSVSQLAGQLGGLASFAGFELGGNTSVDKSTLAIEVIKSWDFLENFIRENHIEVAIYSAIGWDPVADRLILDPNLYNEERSEWVLGDGKSEKIRLEPTGWDLYNAFSNRVSIAQDANTGLYTLTVQFFSPNLSKIWAELLVKHINEHFRTIELNEAKQSIEYLNQQIQKTNNKDMQAVFYQLIQEQTKSLMLAEIKDEYVLKTISPAKIPESPSGPRRKLFVIIGALIGYSLGVIAVLLSYLSKKS